jgi:mono/diheme cytochrome c family protein
MIRATPLRRWLCGALVPVVVALGGIGTRQVAAQIAGSQARPGYDVGFIGQPLADPVMQHAKETFVLYGCAYCHGVTLIPRGEAADLMHSPLVGADVDGSTIVALLKAGIPQTAKLSPMPQFSDLSDRQLHDIADYIHYTRQRGRYKELIAHPLSSGDAAAGKSFFDANCSSCHARDFAGIGRKYDAATLRQELLDPTALRSPLSFAVSDRHDTGARLARDRHHAFLENGTDAQVADLMSYLSTR